MNIDTNENIDSTNNEAEEVIETTQEENNQEETQEENTQEKYQETPEAKLARLERQTKQLKRKLGLESEPQKTTQKSDGLDYGQKAFLVANGIKESAEMKLVQGIMQETGKNLEQVLGSKYFQAELNEMRELQTSKNAIPTGKRSGNVPTESVEYWMTKDFKDVPADMKAKVVNARLNQDKAKGVFYNS